MTTDPHLKPVCEFLKKVVVRYWGKADALAEEIGVDESTVNRWLTGKRTPGVDDLHRIVAVTLASSPDDKAVLARWLVDALVGGQLQVLSKVPDPTPRPYLKEVRDAREVQNQFDEAVDSLDDDAVDAAWDRGREELDQQRSAAHQEITRRRAPRQLSLVPSWVAR
jgi:transcriptional regulator with XRE-family HTH domain